MKNIKTWFRQLVCDHKYELIDTQQFTTLETDGRHYECFSSMSKCPRCGKLKSTFEKVAMA